MYVPVVGRFRLVMNSGLVPVSIGPPMTWPAGFLSVKMKSVEPPGMPSTVAKIRWPAVPLNGIEATGAAAVISPVDSTIGAPY